MPYSSFEPSVYTNAGNSVVQSSYNPVMMGSVSAGACPQGSLSTGCCTSNQLPTEHYVSGEIPLTSQAYLRNPGNPTNPPSQTLSQVVSQAYRDTQAQNQVKAFDMQCCPNPPPCNECVGWRAQFKGCPYTYAADSAELRCEVAPLGDRYWVADLDPLKFERSLMQGAEPNPYDFMNARQMFMQFLMKDWVQTKDPYTRPISDLDQSYCMKLKTKGPPMFTVF